MLVEEGDSNDDEDWVLEDEEPLEVEFDDEDYDSDFDVSYVDLKSKEGRSLKKRRLSLFFFLFQGIDCVLVFAQIWRTKRRDKGDTTSKKMSEIVR